MAELTNEMAEIKESVKQSLYGVKQDVRKEMGEMKESMAALKALMTKHFE